MKTGEKKPKRKLKEKEKLKELRREKRTDMKVRIAEIEENRKKPQKIL